MCTFRTSPCVGNMPACSTVRARCRYTRMHPERTNRRRFESSHGAFSRVPSFTTHHLLALRCHTHHDTTRTRRQNPLTTLKHHMFTRTTLGSHATVDNQTQPTERLNTTCAHTKLHTIRSTHHIRTTISTHTPHTHTHTHTHTDTPNT